MLAKNFVTQNRSRCQKLQLIRIVSPFRGDLEGLGTILSNLYERGFSITVGLPIYAY